MNINHLIFVHHIVLSISQYQYVDSYIWPSFIEILGSRLKSRKSLDGQIEIVFVDYCSEPRWTEGKYSQSILFWNAKGAVRHRLLLLYNIFVHLQSRLKTGCSIAWRSQNEAVELGLSVSVHDGYTPCARRFAPRVDNMIIRCYRLNARPCFFFVFFSGGYQRIRKPVYVFWISIIHNNYGYP